MAKDKRSSSLPSQSKTSKKSNNSHDQKLKIRDDLNRLIRVLRPKVYIIDSLSFKTLVHELTGNGSSSPEKVQLPSVDVDSSGIFSEACRDQEDHSLGFGSGDTSLGSYSEANGSNDYDRIYTDLLPYWDVESTLLVDTTSPYTFCHGFDEQFHQDVSIYDYELFGLL